MNASNDKRESEECVRTLYKAAEAGEQVHLSLDTDDRVLARVTDGIYRQPASAIRELLANAYDADATEVAIITDTPRYSEIMVRDNGNGMTGPVLINLIRHIGGSAKRTPVGQELGITSPEDAKLSPGGRKLIGKIGIGLFSVSQLTRQFTIITKPKSEKYRYKAVVTLHRYTDEELQDATPGKRFTTGKTVITPEVAGEDEASGTTIVLGNLIPRVKEILQSKDIWDALLHSSQQDRMGVVRRVEPAIHSGFLRPGTDNYQREPKVPWAPRTGADERMLALTKALLEIADKNELYTQLTNAFDYYFRMVWTLGLSLPLSYIDIHPFDLPNGRILKCFLLSNRTKAGSIISGDDQASDLRTGPKTSVAAASKIEPAREGDDFRVEIDGLRLYRPVRFDAIKGSSRALQTPLLFVGGFNPDLQKYEVVTPDGFFPGFGARAQLGKPPLEALRSHHRLFRPKDRRTRETDGRGWRFRLGEIVGGARGPSSLRGRGRPPTMLPSPGVLTPRGGTCRPRLAVRESACGRGGGGVVSWLRGRSAGQRRPERCQAARGTRDRLTGAVIG
jgi:hypothetical protein